eukprot:4399827-Prymnesium_polylepis.1
MRPARAPGQAGGSSRQQGRARGVRVLTVVAARRRRGSAVWRAPPSHASPGDGAPLGRHGVGT